MAPGVRFMRSKSGLAGAVSSRVNNDRQWSQAANPNSGVRRPILSSRLHGLAKLSPIGVQTARQVALEGVIETDGGPVAGAVCDELGGAESGLLVRHLLRQQGRLHAISDLQLLQDIGHVMLDRLFAQKAYPRASTRAIC